MPEKRYRLMLVVQDDGGEDDEGSWTICHYGRLASGVRRRGSAEGQARPHLQSEFALQNCHRTTSVRGNHVQRLAEEFTPLPKHDCIV